jgi:acyl-coenzyme A synthetase/AMP-(fatty) acid ligase
VGEAPEQDVSKWFASLGAHCRPENVEKVDEIPVNDTGKISRTMLQSRDMEILQGINWTG